MKHHITRRMDKKRYNDFSKRHGLISPIPIVYRIVTGKHYRSNNIIKARRLFTSVQIRNWNKEHEK